MAAAYNAAQVMCGALQDTPAAAAQLLPPAARDPAAQTAEGCVNSTDAPAGKRTAGLGPQPAVRPLRDMTVLRLIAVELLARSLILKPGPWPCSCSLAIRWACTPGSRGSP